jgi:glycosyltransferase involved in cell wall biosynthesis
VRERLRGERRVLIACQGEPGGFIRDPDFFYTRGRQLVRWLRSLAPAIVVPNWVWSAYGVCQIAIEDGHDLRVLAFCRSDSEQNYYDPLVRRQQQFDWVAAVSPECRQVLLERLPGMAARIRLLPTFVERPVVLDRAWQRNPIRLIYAGRVEQADKRVLDLLPLARELLAGGVEFTLTVAGEGSMTLHLLKGLADMRHEGRVRLVGSIAPADMPQLFRQHDVFVQLSSTEGLSNSLLEAMSAGAVPVATRTRSGVAGVIKEKINGYLCAVGDVRAISRAISELARSASPLEQLGAAAHYSTAQYGWEPYRARLTGLLTDIEQAGPRLSATPI